MTTWFTSDQHYGHKNIIKHCDRPFADVDEMNHSLLKRFNERVQAGDIVYHLGDFSMDERLVALYAKQLRGRHFLVPGNHDACHSRHKHHIKAQRLYRAAGLTVLPEQFEVHFDGLGHVLLCHMPLRVPLLPDERYAQYRPEDKLHYRYILHGHVHEKWRRNGKMLNVGVDQWGYGPVSLGELHAFVGG